MPDTCPHCGKGGFKRIGNHFQRSPDCAKLMFSESERPMSVEPPIPLYISTITPAVAPVMEDDEEEGLSGFTPRVSSRRREVVNYSEATAKRSRNDKQEHFFQKIDHGNNKEDHCFQSPDLDLADYIGTFFDNHPEKIITPESPALRTTEEHHPLHSLEMAKEAWNSVYASEQTYHSVAAVATLPLADLGGTQVQQELGESNDHGLGQIVNVTMKQQNSRVVATPHDRSMAWIYRICDKAGSPRYLADSIIQQLRKESVENGFDVRHPGVNRRDAFMHRASKSIGSTPPQAIPITLESGQTVTVFRFPFIQTLQNHLLSSVFSNLENLSVNSSDPWGAYSTDGEILMDAHDGTCYQVSVKQFLESTPNPENYCFSPLMGYIDKTGTDGIEKNSLEPWMWVSTCVRQSKREDSKSWFPGGFVPNLTMISAAARRGQKGSQYTKSAAVRDYHRCLEVILHPLKELQRC